MAARYDLSRYSIPDDGVTLRRSFDAGESAAVSVISGARDLPVLLLAATRATLRAEVSGGWPGSVSAAGRVDVTARAQLMFLRVFAGAEDVRISAAAGQNRYGRLTLRENVQVFAGSLINSRRVFAADESTQIISRGTLCFARELAAKETTGLTALSVVNCYYEMTARETGAAGVDVRKDMYRTAMMTDAVRLRLYVGKDMRQADAWAAEKAALTVRPAKDFPRALLGTECVIVTAGAAFIDLEVLRISVEIPPGGELVIDTENYTVTLNGENVLHLQEGDWIRVSRELLGLSVSAGTGGALTGTLTAREQYL